MKNRLHSPHRNGRANASNCCCNWGLMLLWIPILLMLSSFIGAHAASDRVYPRRTQQEAAVIEWGHSAIISALDVSVAHFGPQTSQAALFEVETMPILASPVNGVMTTQDENEQEQIEQEAKLDTSPIIGPLDNADDVKGNVVVMTNAGGLLTGVQMAKIAQLSGAAALLVVNVDEQHPDDIYRLDVVDDSEQAAAAEIDIPVVMMSYNSATVLTSATVTPDMKSDEVVNHGMPDRVRLYAGGDRPFFEDIMATDPAVYLIHNLLTDEECDALVRQAASKVQAMTQDDPLQFVQNYKNYERTQAVMLWQGLLQTAGRKALEERIEQATGFPANHFSDFVVYRLDKGAKWQKFVDHFDAAPGSYPIASLTIFLTQPEPRTGAEWVYPNAKGGMVKIRPQKGLSVIHHNLNERHEFDRKTLHSLLEYTGDDPVYIARKYVLLDPVSNARRIALPAFAAPFGGCLPSVVSRAFDLFVEQFGYETGGRYFNKLCVFLPILLVFGLVQLIVDAVQKRVRAPKKEKKDEEPVSARRHKKKRA